MRKVIVVLALILSCSMVVSSAVAEVINLNPDPNGTPWYAGLPELTPEQELKIQQIPKLTTAHRLFSTQAAATSADNSANQYFRPVFHQSGGSCAQASGIGYTFTYEMAYMRGLDASLTHNQYPEHFTYNFLNMQSEERGSWFIEGWDIAKDNGIPDVNTYGSMSSASPYVEWMSGYDKYYAGMSNRALRYFTIDVSTPDGIETMRQWLLHHAEGAPVGGLLNFSVYMNGVAYNVLDANSPYAGETVITSFGTVDGGHAMTIVGFDDTIMYDYNDDGQYTNTVDINGDGVVDVRDWEIGAVKVANSWGDDWKNDGFVWVMYSVLAYEREEGGVYGNMAFGLRVKEINLPKMALKVSMTHAMRNKIHLSAGVAADENATVPDHQISYRFINFQGGELPMRGDSSAPIEIGLDVSALYDRVGETGSKKFFLIIDENDSGDDADGEIVSLSLIDYTNAGYESVGESNVAIENNFTTYAGVVRNINTGSSGECIEVTATNSVHASENRAYRSGLFTYYAAGSNDRLGSGRTTTTLAQTSPGHWILGECPESSDPPVVDITAPADGDLVSEIVEVSANASDDVGVDRVVFSVPNYTICTDETAPYSCLWDTMPLTNGTYTVTATAYDVTGASATSTISVSVDNVIGDIVAPEVTITQPANGATVSGTVISHVNATDNDRVDRVIFSAPGMIICVDATAPYECEGDTTELPNGTYPFTATAYDVSGNSAAETILVTIENQTGDPDPPIIVITTPTDGEVVSGIVTAHVDASDVGSGIASVDCSIPGFTLCDMDTPPYDCTQDTRLIEDGVYVLTCTAYDFAGNSDSHAISVTVNNNDGCQDWTTTNYTHASEGRAYRNGFFNYSAVGSDDPLGRGSATTTVREDPPGSGIFREGSCPEL